VQTISEPGRHGDGEGLYLDVGEDGTKRWLLRFQLYGRRRDMGLGPLTKDNGLAEARQAARDARAKIAKGIDPIEARKRPTGVPTFEEMAKRVIEDLAPGWRGKYTKPHWERSLLNYAAKLKLKPINQIDTADVLSVLRPMWTSKPESAGKVRERLERVLDAAKAAGHIDSPWENPARWRGHLAHFLPKRQMLSRGHMAAMPYQDAPAFMATIRTRQGMGYLALEWTILTVAREGMTTGARIKEVDADAKLWIVPAARMKDGKEHRVPLPDAAMALYAKVRAEKRDPGEYLFPGSRPDTALSNMTMDMALRRLKAPYTVHGFRSTFRDWAGDCTDHPREVVEAALAHAVGSAVERAYRRGDALEKRRKLMQDWADFLAKPPSGRASAE
jgi:integrase